MNAEPDMMADYPRGNVHQVTGPKIGLKYRRKIKFGLGKWKWPVEE